MTRKEQLYYLLNNYRNKKYDTACFCDQFVQIYSMDVHDKNMTAREKEYMSRFCRLAERYSPYEEDLSSSSFFIDDTAFRTLFDDLYSKLGKEYP